MLKAQCRCGHRVAVADGYAGKRVKCPKCQGAILIPGGELAAVGAGKGAASSAAGRAAARPANRPVGSPPAHVARAAAQAPEPVVESSASRHARAKRKAMEAKRKAHNRTVALVATVMVLAGLGAMLAIGILNKPAAKPVEVAQNTANDSSSAGTKNTTTSLPKPIARKTAPMASDESPDSGDTQPPATTDSSDQPAATTPNFVAASNGATPVATTATFDAGGNVTTITSQSTPIVVGEKTLQMVVTIKYDGKDLRAATDLGAGIRISGDFTGLATAGLPDEPRLTIEADAREFFVPPTARDDSNTRKKENGPEILPTWVEYSLGRAELLTIAQGKSLRVTISGTLVDLKPEQIALFQSVAPPAPKPDPAKEVQPEPGAAPEEKGANEETTSSKELNEDKEVMDEKEMKKK